MKLIGLVIQLAPIAIFCFMFNLAAQFGWDLIVRLSAYVGVVLLALGLQMFVIFPIILRTLAKKSPVAFFRETQEAFVMAFATASSNATPPTSLRVAHRSEEHTSELQSLMRISYAVFCLTQKKQTTRTTAIIHTNLPSHTSDTHTSTLTTEI